MYVPYVSRMDYAAGMFYEAIVVNAPERLANIPVPKRASYIRVLMLIFLRMDLDQVQLYLNPNIFSINDKSARLRLKLRLFP